MLVDTHAHVNFHAFRTDAAEVLQRSLDCGTWVVNVGSQRDTSRQSLELANRFGRGVYAVVGLHPEHTHSSAVKEEQDSFQSREEVFDQDFYKTLAQHSKVVGVGECGLDYYHFTRSGLADKAAIEIIKGKQKAAFAAQIELARELDKALVVHSRPAPDTEDLYNDLLEILGSGRDGLRFVVHSYTGSPEFLESFLDRGAYVSFNGIITFDKTGNMERLVKIAPLDRIVLETDSPYLTPAPLRGQRNQPCNLSHVAEKVAALRGLEVAEVERLTTANAAKLFRIDTDPARP